MRYGKAVDWLRALAERCEQVSRLWAGDEVAPLTGAYAFGEVLDGPDQLDVVSLALVLDHPAEELTWCAKPESCWGLAHLLELHRAPVEWYWRPDAWPVGNHVIVRPLRIWSPIGVDTGALEALAARAADRWRLAAPDRAQEDEQLAFEFAASMAYLREVEMSFWERDWRAGHRGNGVYPEEHLWDAVHGFLDLHDALLARREAGGVA